MKLETLKALLDVRERENLYSRILDTLERFNKLDKVTLFTSMVKNYYEIMNFSDWNQIIG